MVHFFISNFTANINITVSNGQYKPHYSYGKSPLYPTDSKLGSPRSKPERDGKKTFSAPQLEARNKLMHSTANHNTHRVTSALKVSV
jgi:hypothetical protein